MKLPHTLSGWISLATAVSTAMSLTANLLPNAKCLDGYPRTQKAYNAVVNIIAATALNLRHCLPSLGISAPALGITKGAQPPKQ